MKRIMVLLLGILLLIGAASAEETASGISPSFSAIENEGIVFHEGNIKHIYFVAEAKGSIRTMDLRPIEKAKIDCAEKLFNTILLLKTYSSPNLNVNYLRAINRPILCHLTYDASRARIRGPAGRRISLRLISSS